MNNINNKQNPGGPREEKSHPTNKNNQKRNKYLIISASVVLITLIVALCIIIPIITVKADKDALIKIPKDATREMVRDSVSKYLGKSYADIFSKVGLLNSDSFKKRHGAYMISKGDNSMTAYRKLTRGGQTPIKITIQGSRLPENLADKLSEKLDFSADSLLEAMRTDSLLSPYGLNRNQGIALFLDDTYEVYWTISPTELIKKMGDNYNKVWNEGRRKKAVQIGLSPIEIITVASIVEEETAKSDDKGKIGRLYINRLKKGMKLQADPTIKYALKDFSLRRIRGEHLKVESPYNTYHHIGLPPSPIKTTSTATIDSILNSQPSNYLYMCAKADFSGYHAFAETYSEHMKNARAYQKALNKRGIK